MQKYDSILLLLTILIGSIKELDKRDREELLGYIDQEFCIKCGNIKEENECYCLDNYTDYNPSEYA